MLLPDNNQFLDTTHHMLLSYILSLLYNSIPPSLPVVGKIVSTAPDLQPKQPAVVDDNLLEEDEMEGGLGKEEGEGEVGDGGDSESDDEDDVQITIGEITTIPGGYNRTPSYTRMAIAAGGEKSV